MRLSLLLLCFGLCGPLAAEEFKQEAWQKLEKTVSQAIAQKNTAGAIVWLEHQGKHQTFVTGSLTLSPDVTMTLDSIFDAASLTKVIATAPAIMLLKERGQLDLEAPVSRYIPEFIGAGREKILVRHLLTHESGLNAGLPREPAWTGYEEGIRLATQTTPSAAPETFFRYSDINFILLGEIVRRVSGQSLHDFTQQHLFAPLKMASTRYLPPEEWRQRIAPTEKDEKGIMLTGVVHDPTARRMGGIAGHAGLFTCAEDLARFARMILNRGELEGVRVFKPETLQTMEQVQSSATTHERRGFGWDIDSPFSRPRGDTFPIGSFGHTGFTGTSLWLDPYSKSFVIFLSSRLYPDGKGGVRELYEKVGSTAAQAIPGFDFKNVSGSLPKRREGEVPTVLNGIDALKRDGFSALQDLRVGLITNHTGIDAERVATIDLLAAAPKVQLKALFSPEHGIRGTQDQEKIQNSTDRKTGLPIYSLYGEQRAPTAKQLENLDALVFDIQDIGCRFYTYISTLRLCMEAAAASNKKFFVLDRINPIGGLAVEGPAILDKESFTATHAIPLRHGMTVGELALLLNSERSIGADLTVIKLEGWRRDLHFDYTGLPWINPSPNMRSSQAALLYPGIGLMEFSISVGRGTDTPFEVLGAPYANDLALSAELNKFGLPGVRFSPIRFTPTTSIFKDKTCGGVRIQILDRETFKPVQAGLAIITVFRRLYPSQFDLDKVNTLLNHKALLKALKDGKSWRDLSAMWELESHLFETRRAGVLMY